MNEKLKQLQEYLLSQGSVAVAFSGGVDSTFLLKVAHDTLGDKCVAVTASSCSFPERELKEAKAFCERNGIRHVVVRSEELEIEGFRHNPKNRCYLCKHELFEKIWDIARELGLNAVAEGSNMDDNGDYRPGLVAVRELGVLSPLRHVGLSKAEIRELSRELGLPTWNKQSFACLASRFVYGEERLSIRAITTTTGDCWSTTPKPSAFRSLFLKARFLTWWIRWRKPPASAARLSHSAPGGPAPSGSG